MVEEISQPEFGCFGVCVSAFSFRFCVAMQRPKTIVRKLLSVGPMKLMQAYLCSLTRSIMILFIIDYPSAGDLCMMSDLHQ